MSGIAKLWSCAARICLHNLSSAPMTGSKTDKRASFNSKGCVELPVCSRSSVLPYLAALYSRWYVMPRPHQQTSMANIQHLDTLYQILIIVYKRGGVPPGSFISR
ncbi:hypothetical protein PTI98_006798 [Pleurotus ostreatus]|nr:hypothetical protein PTI98_006798 [Pleurotus ostreatus]